MSISDVFPAGLRILVVDDDPLCLVILERMLRTCSYSVKTCSTASSALSILREKKEKFDLVISDVHMPDMDGVKLMEQIGLELDLPVIMMSANSETGAVMQSITHGACDYLLKPVRIEELRNIWQHVVRKKSRDSLDESYTGECEPVSKLHQHQNQCHIQETNLEPHHNQEGDEGKEKSSGSGENKKRKGVDSGESDMGERAEESSGLKKPRVVWSADLHQRFVAAVNKLGLEKAVPKKILEIMKVGGLTRENVASHLQKYRLYLKRLSGAEAMGSPLSSFRMSGDGNNFGGRTGSTNPSSSNRELSNVLREEFGLRVNTELQHPKPTSQSYDDGTQAILDQLQALQQRKAVVDSLKKIGLGLQGTGVSEARTLSPHDLGLASLHGLSSQDLDLLMQAHQEISWRQNQTQIGGASAPESSMYGMHNSLSSTGRVDLTRGGGGEYGSLTGSLGSNLFHEHVQPRNIDLRQQDLLAIWKGNSSDTSLNPLLNEYSTAVLVQLLNSDCQLQRKLSESKMRSERN